MDPDRGDVRGPIIVHRVADRTVMDKDKGRPRSNGRRRGPPGGERPGRHHHGGRPTRNDYAMQAPMRILTKPSDRMNVPGTVSIMQRDASSSSGDLPTSPHSHHRNSDSGLPPTSNHTHPINHRLPPTSSSTNHLLDPGNKRLIKRQEGVSSSPSSYTPLYPSNNRGGRSERDGMFSRTDSGFAGNVSGDTFCTKLVNKKMEWEDKVTEHLMEQSDFLVVGCLGKQGCGKSTVMSLLAGTRTGSGRPYLFRTQSKDTMESNGYQTNGVDIVVTSERVILLDTQPILSDALLEQLMTDGLVPSGMSPESYLDVISLQMAIFMLSVCHVVVVVMESEDIDVMLRFLLIAENLKPQACKLGYETEHTNDGMYSEYFPQIVFVLNHASADDFQPYALKDLHGYISERIVPTRLSVAGGISLACSGLVATGRLVPDELKGVPGLAKSKGGRGEVEESNINLHLLPTNSNPQDSFGAHCVERNDKQDIGLNPVLRLIPVSYRGHPSFQVLSEALRNQVFSMPRPSLRPTRGPISNQPHPQQQPMFEKEWHDFARRMFSVIRASDIPQEHKRLLRDMKT